MKLTYKTQINFEIRRLKTYGNKIMYACFRCSLGRCFVKKRGVVLVYIIHELVFEIIEKTTLIVTNTL
jgi:hypothetical protein